jgi:hypothetical protein
MGEFDFVFSLFGLLLGFSLVEVLSGLVRTLKLRHPPGPHSKVAVRIGWLTPLLGLFVLVDLTSFWNIAWRSRDAIPANFGTMLIGVAVTGLYYFSASMVFPDKPEDWPDFDEWAARHKRQVISGILICNLIVTALILLPRPQFWTFPILTQNGGLLAIMALAAFARPRWLTGTTLVGMLVFYAWLAWHSLRDARHASSRPGALACPLHRWEKHDAIDSWTDWLAGCFGGDACGSANSACQPYFGSDRRSRGTGARRFDFAGRSQSGGTGIRMERRS